ncbi:MAG: hypothetical protein A2Y03_06940 [Omnitrophica WOR_2 bacterium GWF2_38_59]|nr:MAG: hypothetical protein A2Y03_06940 [Omnitrophica WOR_2 bacterium GWF2_38_59]OGX47403.1 MAG: hypothetical protein A2243_01585 [Omnitrophica WOR_2 bacterium RIFOXYA2_FULL_38_17]OGX54256.1 MAG: hypothetical protein A2267_01945 [Omnitrophica WOR_2 bacterium RIFOXYA12_FULL_38_10]OGX55034.1 MAG: hypothetical protein A2447_10905 [Omnitrophica WOR_2 bacterium RIFOXYC2_FULL_38_12]OGX60505.1 MAG: hypothetical protein A2306_07790 [Omnitrophica WOR_2 bacterium RIFOXYB2_FULL_38_16]HBG62287.1 hypothet
MINRKISVFVLAICLMIPSTICLAADVTEQDVTPSSKRIFLDPQKSFLEKGTFKYLLGFTGGFDNNAHLDSQRDADSFLQSFFKASFITPLSEKTTGTFNYEMMSLLYSGESDLSLARNGINAEAKHEIDDNISVSSEMSFDSIEFLRSGNDDYLDSGLGLKAKQKLPLNFYHSLSYKMLFRDYNERAIRVTALVDSDKKRNDWRNTIEYEVGKFFEKDFFKAGFEYFYNNSNERYLDYYDYDSYKFKTSYTHLFNEKVFSYLSFAQQNRQYDARTLINDTGSTEWERTLLSSAAVFYNLNKAVSLGLNYTYRQNYSNEPSDRYSGSLISLSTYWKF